MSPQKYRIALAFSIIGSAAEWIWREPIDYDCMTLSFECVSNNLSLRSKPADCKDSLDGY
jgi:hypothetical protein